MALIEEIQQMRASGASEQDILQNLQSKGVSVQQAYEAMSQAVIKDAVTSDQNQYSQQTALQPSMMEQAPAPEDQQYQQQYPAYPQEQYAPQDYSSQSYAPTFSADTISEIADQILTEKLSSIKDSVENVSDFKTSAESRLQALDDRLQRIEKIIDRLQLSILQKVGEQVTNIEDIKKELIETQKTFKALAPQVISKAKPSKQEE